MKFSIYNMHDISATMADNMFIFNVILSPQKVNLADTLKPDQ